MINPIKLAEIQKELKEKKQLFLDTVKLMNIQLIEKKLEKYGLKSQKPQDYQRSNHIENFNPTVGVFTNLPGNSKDSSNYHLNFNEAKNVYKMKIQNKLKSSFRSFYPQLN